MRVHSSTNYAQPYAATPYELGQQLLPQILYKIMPQKSTPKVQWLCGK